MNQLFLVYYGTLSTTYFYEHKKCIFINLLCNRKNYVCVCANSSYNANDKLQIIIEITMFISINVKERAM